MPVASLSLAGRSWKFLISALLLCTLPSPALAQIGGGSVVGNVTDQSGAAVANATVKVTNSATNVTNTSASNEQGYYEFPLLPAGRYVIEVQATGFQARKTTEFELNSGTRPRFDFALSVGDVSETVQVADTETLVKTTSAELGVVIEQRKIEALPLNGRNFQQLVGLQAGVVNSPSSNLGPRGGIEFNGAPALGNNILMDGVDASFIESHGSGGAASAGAGGIRINTVSIEALQEFKTSSNAFSAEYGRATGGVINLTTKSGGKDFHGTAYDFLRNDALDANSWNSNRRAFAKPAFRFNQFGGNLGGPVYFPEKYFGPLGGFNESRDRLFFFFNYEGVRTTSPSAQAGNVPTQALLDAVRNPNIRAYLDTLPKDCVSAVANNPFLCRHERNDQAIGIENTYLARVDYVWGDHRTAFRYNYNKQDADTPGALRRENRFIVPLRSHNAVVQDTWTVSPRIVNEFRIGYNRVFLRRNNATYDLGFGGGLFGWTEVGSVGLTGDFASLLFFRGNSYSLTDNLTWISGAHTFKFGADIREVRSSRIQGTRATHFYSSLNNLINDIPDNVRATFGNPGAGYTSTEYGFYAQDDWRINRRFQLNLGVRYDYYTPFKGSFNVEDQNPFGPFAPEGTRRWEPDRNNFAPRLSFSYDVTGNQKFVVRAGVGVNFAPQAHFNYYDASWIDPRIPFNALLTPSDPLPAGVTLAFPFPQSFVDQIAANPDLLPSRLILGRSLTDPKRRDEYSTHFNLSLQYAVTKNLAVQATYAGSRGVHLLNVNHFNLIDPALGRRPDPTQGLIVYIEGSGRNNYNSLQLSANYRMSSRITGDLYYTFAKNLTYGATDSADGPRQNDIQDFSNQAGSYGPKSGDIRHQLTGVYTFQLPTPKFVEQKGLTRTLFGGWSFQGLYYWRTGVVGNVRAAQDFVGNGKPEGTRPDLIGPIYDKREATAADRAINPDVIYVWLNQNSFDFRSPITQKRFGTSGFNVFYGPNFWNFDASLIKSFKLSEGHRIDFRAEFFNAFNHPNWNAPVITGYPLPATGIVNQSFGFITGKGGNRNIQFGLKYVF